MTTRRDFLRLAGAASLGLAASQSELFAQQSELPRQQPLERIRIGHIGVGGQGTANLRVHLRNTVAVCDVDSARLGAARDLVQRTNGGTCAAHADYRRLLDDRNIDAVIVSTPDHWHALAAIHACQAGKHVYCEKPLTLAIAEGRRLVQAARRHRVVVQTGSQQRSDDRFRLACELVRNGRLGRLHTVRVGLPGVNFQGPAVPDSAPPPELDYNAWLGPAPLRPYNAKHVHYNFRFFWDYSGGQLTNFGAHHLDIVQWALGMDESGPVAIEGTPRHHRDHWYEVPESFDLAFTYASGVRVLCGQANGTRGGVTFEGSEGRLFVNRGVIEATPPELLRTVFGEADTRLPISRNHHQNWLASIASGSRPICDVEIGHRSATVCHLGAIALRTGRRVEWNPVTESVVGDPEQSAHVERPYRAPYRLPVIA